MKLYAIIHRRTGKAYIGITRGKVERRWAEHCRAAKREVNSLFVRAIRRHGPAAFRVEVLAEADTWDALCALERVTIAERGTYGRGGYNGSPGGDGAPPGTVAWNKGRAPSAETRAKLGAALARQVVEKGHPRAGAKMKPGHQEKMRACFDARPGGHPRKGATHTAETKAKMAAAWDRNREARSAALKAGWAKDDGTRAAKTRAMTKQRISKSAEEKQA